MRLLLNIGLAPSFTTSRTTLITALEVKAALRAAGFYILHYEEAESETEPTAVVQVQAPDCLGTLVWCNLCYALRQDCIAVVPEYAYGKPDVGAGFLAGPRSAQWGPFNPEYFIVSASLVFRPEYSPVVEF